MPARPAIAGRERATYAPGHDGATSVLRPGRNCWRVVPATRVAFRIDAEAYFPAFAKAVERARSSVLIVGWDVNDATELWHGERATDPPPQLAPILAHALRRRRSLHVRVLDWELPMLYAMERELLPAYRFAWRTPRRFSCARSAGPTGRTS